MRRILALLLVLAALAVPAAPTPQAAGPSAVLRRDGHWLVDAHGRVVLLHGVNAVWKRAPYVPPATAAGFTARDADWIAAQGFNTVRLGVLFAGVMPTRGKVDRHYLDAVAKVVDLLAARRVWVLLDFHQDLYTERFGGEGFPAWAVHDDGLPQPVSLGFPANYFLPATTRAFDNLYAGVDGLADLYAQAWKAVAVRFARTSYVLGYDVLNEPWPGSATASCANPVGCPVFDSQSLQPLYDKVVAAIRTVDRRRIVWLEPNVLFNDGAQTRLGAVRPLTDPQLGLSWHQYCTTAGLTHSRGGTAGPDCGPQGELVAGNADAFTQAHGLASLLTEYGASDDLADLARVTALADEHLTGWQYWHYKEWSDPTTESADSGGQGLFTKDADLRTVKAAKANLLVRPFARAVAGVPTAMRFDPATGAFTLTYTARPATGLTEVWVPARQYPRGYAVMVRGARVVSRAGASTLLLQAPRAGAVTVTVTRLRG
jgi:endoglycosylceramidase